MNGNERIEDLRGFILLNMSEITDVATNKEDNAQVTIAPLSGQITGQVLDGFRNAMRVGITLRMFKEDVNAFTQTRERLQETLFDYEIEGAGISATYTVSEDTTFRYARFEMTLPTTHLAVNER